MAVTASTDLLTLAKAPYCKQPKIVSKFLNNRRDSGWGSNGFYLMFKDQAIACHSSLSRALLVLVLVLESFAAAFAGSGLVIGLEALPVASVD